MKTIDASWLKKDFKQKYFLYCQDCKTEKLVQKFAQLKDNSYICKQGTSPRKKQIKIEEYGRL